MADVQNEIRDLVTKNEVVLFMKGSKHFPQCGFSATVVQILKHVGREFETVNVLTAPEIREGVKVYSDWPTIPQLYVKGEFVGGCDIIKEMFASGELYDVLGVEKPEVPEPTLTLTDAAKQAIAQAAEGEPLHVRLEVSPDYQYALSIDAPQAGDFQVESNGVTLVLDRESASRADGVTIDFLAAGGGGFKIDNPNEPAKVKQISVQELKSLLDAGGIELFDVRTEQEWKTARIEGAQPYDAAAQEKIAKLDKATPLYFHCHHGGRSNQAAEHYLRQGFANVHNVMGGIDAWSSEIDPKVPRY